jgi:hypothetical protein
MAGVCGHARRAIVGFHRRSRGKGAGKGGVGRRHQRHTHGCQRRPLRRHSQPSLRSGQDNVLLRTINEIAAGRQLVSTDSPACHLNPTERPTCRRARAERAAPTVPKGTPSKSSMPSATQSPSPPFPLPLSKLCPKTKSSAPVLYAERTAPNALAGAACTLATRQLPWPNLPKLTSKEGVDTAAGFLYDALKIKRIY